MAILKRRIPPEVWITLGDVVVPIKEGIVSFGVWYFKFGTMSCK
jgi:hypothetical protein